jgi:hypothetical protein
VWRFIKNFKCLKGKLGRDQKDQNETKFQMFVNFDGIEVEMGQDDFEIQIDDKFQKFEITPIFTVCNDKFTRKSSEEVKQFNNVEFMKMIANEKSVVLFNKSQNLDSLRFQIAGGLENMDVSMGSIADEELTVAPPFWVAMVDIYGPCYIYIFGHSVKTRNMNVVIEVDGFVEGVSQIGCEIGITSFVLVDQDSDILEVLRKVEVESLVDAINKEDGEPSGAASVQITVDRSMLILEQYEEKMAIEDDNFMSLLCSVGPTLMLMMLMILMNTCLGFYRLMTVWSCFGRAQAPLQVRILPV